MPSYVWCSFLNHKYPLVFEHVTALQFLPSNSLDVWAPTFQIPLFLPALLNLSFSSPPSLTMFSSSLFYFPSIHTSLSSNTVPGRPINLNVTAVDSRTIEMTWEPPQLDKRNGIIQRYAVSITTLQLTDEQEMFSSLTNSTSHIFHSLRPYYSYSCAVAAETSAGRGLDISQNIRLPEDGKTVAVHV